MKKWGWVVGGVGEDSVGTPLPLLEKEPSHFSMWSNLYTTMVTATQWIDLRFENATTKMLQEIDSLYCLLQNQECSHNLIQVPIP